jgi:DNA modification methylase
MAPDNYCDWILPLMKESHRVLKPSGSFILNINDKLHKKQRSIYVLDLVVRTVRETNLQLYDRYIWSKKTGLPTGGDKRLNDRIEYIFHFVKDVDKFKCFPDRIRQPYKGSPSRYNRPRSLKKIVDENGLATFNKKLLAANPLGTIPGNVFDFHTGSALRTTKKYGTLHPAPFHPVMPTFFIKWLTDTNDLVLDPFLGSATTAIVAKQMNRNWIGFELNENYKTLIDARLNDVIVDLLPEATIENEGTCQV